MSEDSLVQADDVLTPDAVAFLTDLQREFGGRRREVLARRASRAAKPPSVPPERCERDHEND